MSQETWNAVDDYFTAELVPEQAGFLKALDASDASNLPAISVSANQGMIEVRVRAALDGLPSVEADGVGSFDLAFIDADKQNNPDYFEWAMKLVCPGRCDLGG